jgi:hypothetical protein
MASRDPKLTENTDPHADPIADPFDLFLNRFQTVC